MRLGPRTLAIVSGLLFVGPVAAQTGPYSAARASATAPRPATFAPAVQRFIAMPGPVVAIRNVVLVDGTGAPARPGMTVIVEGDRIAAVGPESSTAVPEGATVVDGTGRTVTPGWVMLHEHMFYPSGQARYNTNEISFPPLYLGGGATTIRTGGSMEAYTDLRLRDQINAGLVAGPRMDVTGPYLEGEGGFVRALPELRTPTEARAHVDFWADRGVTSFKAYNLIDRQTLGAAIEAAHARGIKVTGHLCSITYREAADLGIDDLEHGFRVATDWVDGKEPDVCPGGQARARSYQGIELDSPAFIDLVDHLVTQGVAITATPPVFERGSTGRPLPPQRALDAMLPELRDQVVARYTRARDNPDLDAQAAFAKMQRALRVFVDRGGLLVVGIDPTGGGDVVAGYGNQRAVQLLAEAGFPVEEAVMISTLNGARYLEAADVIGSVEAGKRADLILLEGDLRSDLEALRRPVLVFKDGVAFDAPALLGSVKGTVGLR